MIKNNLMYKKFIIIIFFISFDLINLFALENKILVKINNEIITTIDVENELNYLKILNPQAKNLNQDKLIAIAKKTIIKEKVKKITLLKIIENIDVKDEYLKRVINSMYKKKGMKSLDEYKIYLKNNNVDIKYIKQRISIEAIWNELIFKKFNSKIIIDKEKITNEVLNNPDTKILLSEIIFKPKNKNEFKKKYQEIKNDIEREGFKNAALIHSISNSASSGGNVGWIDKNSLNKKIRNAIDNLDIGEYSDPLLSASGFLILKIEDIKKNISKKKDIDKKVERLIKIKTNQQLNQFSNIYFNKVKKDLIINEL